MPVVLQKNYKSSLLAYIAFMLLVLPLLSNNAYSQRLQEDTIKALTLEEAVSLALDNNFQIKNSRLNIKKAGLLKNEAIKINPTQANLWQGQINSVIHDYALEVEQNFGSPLESYYLSKKANHQEKLSEKAFELKKREVKKETQLAYFDWIYLHHRKKLVKELMDHYQELDRISNIRKELGETDELSRLTAEDEFFKSKIELKKIRNKISMAENNLKMLLNTKHILKPKTDTLSLYAIKHQPLRGQDPISPAEERYYQEKIAIQNLEIKAQKAKFFPQIKAGYFNQQIDNTGGFEGWMVGVCLPLWFFPQKAKVEEARIDKLIAENKLFHQMKKQETAIKNLSHQLNIHHEEIVYFYTTGLKKAELIMKTAEKKYQEEEIEYKSYLESIKKAYEIKTNYLNAVKAYNKTAVKLEYFIN